MTTAEGLMAVPLELLKEAPENPRRIREDKFADLRYTLRTAPEMLDARPLIVDDENAEVIGGNMRLRAARAELAEFPEGELAQFIAQRGGIPTYRRRFPDPAERREWLLRDNADYGEWVPAELALLVDLHQRDHADIRLLGFGQGEIEGLLALARQEEPNPSGRRRADPDAAPKLPEEAETRPGDVIALGDHRLLCGDASNARDWHFMGGDFADVVWTDPPYGVSYDPEADRRKDQFTAERLASPYGALAGDSPGSAEAYAEWLVGVLAQIVKVTRAGGPIYLAHAARMSEPVYRAWREAGLHFAAQLIWAKTRIIFGRGDYHWKHEPVIYGWKPGATHPWLGDRTQGTVLEVAPPYYGERDDLVHPTQKPYELVRAHLANSATGGSIVLDPFAGSGTTMVAAERLGLRARLMEIDPRYCDVIVRRYEALTGESARRPR